MLKRISLWLSTGLFSLSILGLLISTTLLLLVRPATVKTWVEKSGTYSSLPRALITEAAKKQSSEGNGSVGFDSPLMQHAAKDALSPDFLRSSTATIVDGSAQWLEGDTPMLDFSINLQPVKQTFVDSLGKSLFERYDKLPACAPNTPPTTTDPFTIECRPAAGVDIEAVIAEQKEAVLASKDFLPENSLTANSITGNNSALASNSAIPAAYQASRLAPIVFAVLAVISGLCVVFLSSSKRAGLRKIGWRLSITGGLALIATALAVIGLTQTKSLSTKQGDDAMITIYKDIVAGLLSAVSQDFAKVGFILAGITLLLGMILLFTTRRQKSKDAGTNKKTSKPSNPTPPPVPPKTPAATTPQTPAPSAPIPPKPAPRKPRRTLIQ